MQVQRTPAVTDASTAGKASGHDRLATGLLVMAGAGSLGMTILDPDLGIPGTSDGRECRAGLDLANKVYFLLTLIARWAIVVLQLFFDIATQWRAGGGK